MAILQVHVPSGPTAITAWTGSSPGHVGNLDGFGAGGATISVVRVRFSRR